MPNTRCIRILLRVFGVVWLKHGTVSFTFTKTLVSTISTVRRASLESSPCERIVRLGQIYGGPKESNEILQKRDVCMFICLSLCLVLFCNLDHAIAQRYLIITLLSSHRPGKISSISRREREFGCLLISCFHLFPISRACKRGRSSNKYRTCAPS